MRIFISTDLLTKVNIGQTANCNSSHQSGFVKIEFE
jgi:hypothetical protein